MFPKYFRTEFRIYRKGFRTSKTLRYKSGFHWTVIKLYEKVMMLRRFEDFKAYFKQKLYDIYLRKIWLG